MSTLNYTIVGSPTYTGEIVSGFTTTDFLRTPKFQNSSTDSAVVLSFTTGADVTTAQTVVSGIFMSRLTIYNGELLCYGDIGASSKVMDVSASSKYYVRLSPNGDYSKVVVSVSSDGSSWLHATDVNDNDSYLPFYIFIGGIGTQTGVKPSSTISSPFQGSIDLRDFSVRDSSDNISWQPYTPGSITGLSYGSIFITEGFYNSGTAQIRMPTQTISLADLMDGQEVSYKNKTFACSYNGTASVAITSAAAPSGTYDVYVDLEHPLYLSNLQNYLIGDTPSKYIEIGFNRAGSTPLTNNLTENGTAGGDTSAAFSSTNEGSYYAYKAFDGNSSTFWNPSSASNPQDLTRYYPETVYVNSVRFVCREKPSAGSIQISEDNSTYTTIGSFSGNTSDDFTVSCDDSVGGKYIRFHKTGNNTGWGGLYEMIINTTTVSEIHTTQKGFLYDETTNRTFWFPNQVTLPFADFTAVADRCNVYAINSTESDLAALEVNTSAPQDADSYTENNYVFLNSAHDTILKTGQLPDEIKLETAALEILDCTQVGTPTITSDFVASGFSSSDYLKPNSVFPSSGIVIVLMKVSVDSAFSANQPFLCTPTGDRGLYIQNSSKKFAFYDGTGRISNTVVSAGKTYWVRYGFTTSSKASSLRVIEDQGYTEETLPDLSTWDYTGWTSSENTFGGLSLQIGYNTGSGLYYDCGKIYLEHVSYTQDNIEVWRGTRPVAASTIVRVLEPYNWTYLGKFTREETGESLNVSSMTGTATSGYICYSPLGGLVYFEGTSEQVPDTTNLGYPFTGYTVTFTDSTHTAIDKLEQTGTRCRIYSYISGATQKCVAVTYDQYNSGVPAGTVVKYNTSSDSGLPLSCTADKTIVGHTQPDPIGDDYYDPATDTFYIYDGVSQYDSLSYLDDYFVNLS